MSPSAARLVALACALWLAGAALAAAPATHGIQVRIEPETRRLEGRDSLRFDAPRAATLVLSSRFSLDAVTVDGQRTALKARLDGGFQRIALPAARRIDLRWHGSLAPLDRSLGHRDTLGY